MRDARWDELIQLREQVLVALEGLRKGKTIGSAQEAKVRITTGRPERWLPDRELLATLCIVSEVEIVGDPAATAETVQAERSPHAKCERCWNYRPGVSPTPETPRLRRTAGDELSGWNPGNMSDRTSGHRRRSLPSGETIMRPQPCESLGDSTQLVVDD
jgi:isoleucyl-tRNA synthetase